MNGDWAFILNILMDRRHILQGRGFEQMWYLDWLVSPAAVCSLTHGVRHLETLVLITECDEVCYCQ